MVMLQQQLNCWRGHRLKCIVLFIAVLVLLQYFFGASVYDVKFITAYDFGVFQYFGSPTQDSSLQSPAIFPYNESTLDSTAMSTATVQSSVDLTTATTTTNSNETVVTSVPVSITVTSAAVSTALSNATSLDSTVQPTTLLTVNPDKTVTNMTGQPANLALCPVLPALGQF